MNISVGEIIELNEGREFICFAKTTVDGKVYIWLVSNFKPVEVSFARILDEEDKIELIGNQEEKEKIFQAFRQQGLL